MKVKVEKLKTEVVSEVTCTMKEKVKEQVREEVKEIDQQKQRGLNLMCFNMEESRSTTAKERKKCDEKNFRELCSAISVENVDIKAMFRIGIQKEMKNRPLKIVLNNKRERKQILDNVRH